MFSPSRRAQSPTASSPSHQDTQELDSTSSLPIRSSDTTKDSNNLSYNASRSPRLMSESKQSRTGRLNISEASVSAPQSLAISALGELSPRSLEQKAKANQADSYWQHSPSKPNSRVSDDEHVEHDGSGAVVSDAVRSPDIPNSRRQSQSMVQRGAIGTFGNGPESTYENRLQKTRNASRADPDDDESTLTEIDANHLEKRKATSVGRTESHSIRHSFDSQSIVTRRSSSFRSRRQGLIQDQNNPGDSDLTQSPDSIQDEAKSTHRDSVVKRSPTPNEPTTPTSVSAEKAISEGSSAPDEAATLTNSSPPVKVNPTTRVRSYPNYGSREGSISKSDHDIHRRYGDSRTSTVPSLSSSVAAYSVVRSQSMSAEANHKPISNKPSQTEQKSSPEMNNSKVFAGQPGFEASHTPSVVQEPSDVPENRFTRTMTRHPSGSAEERFTSTIPTQRENEQTSKSKEQHCLIRKFRRTVIGKPVLIMVLGRELADEVYPKLKQSGKQNKTSVTAGADNIANNQTSSHDGEQPTN